MSNWGVNECSDVLSFINQSQGFDPTKKKRTERSLLRELANANSRREYEENELNS